MALLIVEVLSERSGRRMIFENKAKDNLESPKEFAESVFGVSFGNPSKIRANPRSRSSKLQ